ncbi:MAG: cytochrome c3 family protein [Thermoanaerobaculia bacterium]
MAQIFPEKANRVPLYLVAGVLVGGALVALGVWYYFSPEYTDVGYRPEQPVPYSHALHAGELRLDCRYCHAGVEVSAVASVPPTEVCMNCHALVGRDLESLEPVRASAADGEPLRWVRVHDLPDYAFFDHSMHVGAGVGCSSCHGDVASMEVVTQVEPLSMAWCLECHRDPGPHLRPFDQITNTAWTPPANQDELAARWIEERDIQPPEACSACHH